VNTIGASRSLERAASKCEIQRFVTHRAAVAQSTICDLTFVPTAAEEGNQPLVSTDRFTRRHNPEQPPQISQLVFGRYTDRVLKPM
jgi:hypothetical protein